MPADLLLVAGFFHMYPFVTMKDVYAMIGGIRTAYCDLK